MYTLSLSEIKYALTDWIETRSAERSSWGEIRPSFEEVNEILRSMDT